jgi:hypothetical protein
VVLRARIPEDVEQEVYALLVIYQALRTAMADAAMTVPGTDPTAPASVSRVAEPVRAAALQSARSQARPITARTASGVSCR